MRRFLRLPLLAALVAALALGLVACGDDDDDAATPATTAEAPASLTLTGEGTTLALDSGTAEVLADNMVEVAPIDPATAGDDGITFPITGGTVESESLAGTIEHSGGLVFTAGGTELELTDFVIDTAAGTLSATAGGAQVPILDVDLTGLERSDDMGTIVLEGITVTLSADGAAALNDTFGVTLFEEGLAIGDVTVRATA
ncbi:HtaA domain-containing protein [Miltoncostaea oceani]|uniref:HtaA domain-containing protein n=1 Tax=Miltoncostaea oceani TaxID=2843216 RepID=UPI001C3CE59B|nr:HtaA domain-containing protein [Miltoncostaea oceani]